jgi:hypothetical protein
LFEDLDEAPGSRRQIRILSISDSDGSSPIEALEWKYLRAKLGRGGVDVSLDGGAD